MLGSLNNSRPVRDNLNHPTEKMQIYVTDQLSALYMFITNTLVNQDK